MARIQVRYVTKRVKPNGRIYWYWQRRGFPLTRLPDDEAERLAMATNKQTHTVTPTRQAWHPSKGQSVACYCPTCKCYRTRSRIDGTCPFCGFNFNRSNLR